MPAAGIHCRIHSK